MRLISQYKGLPRQVYMICIARIITAMGAFIFSFSTLLMTGILGMSEIAVGYVMIGLSLASTLGAVLCGRLADRYSRKTVLLLIMALQIVVLTAGGFLVYQRAVIVCILMVSFCFSGFLPVLSAMITDVTAESDRKESFSLLFLCINIGYAVGQIIAGMLFYDHTPWIFWGQAVAFVIATIFIFFLVDDVSPNIESAKSVLPARRARQDEQPEQPERSEQSEQTARSEKPEGQEQANTGVRSFGSFLYSLMKDRILLIFLLAIILVQFCYTEVSYLLPLQLSALFGLEASSKWISYVWMVNGFSCVLLTPLLLSVTRQKSQIVNVMIAALLYAAGFGGYALAGTGGLLLIVLLTPVWTAGEVMIGTGTGVFIAERARPEFRATYQSLYELSSDVGRCMGPLITGYLLQSISYKQGWYVTAAVGAAAAVFLIYCYRLYRKETA